MKPRSSTTTTTTMATTVNMVHDDDDDSGGSATSDRTSTGGGGGRRRLVDDNCNKEGWSSSTCHLNCFKSTTSSTTSTNQVLARLPEVTPEPDPEPEQAQVKGHQQQLPPQPQPRFGQLPPATVHHHQPVLLDNLPEVIPEYEEPDPEPDQPVVDHHQQLPPQPQPQSGQPPEQPQPAEQPHQPEVLLNNNNNFSGTAATSPNSDIGFVSPGASSAASTSSSSASASESASSSTTSSASGSANDQTSAASRFMKRIAMMMEEKCKMLDFSTSADRVVTSVKSKPVKLMRTPSIVMISKKRSAFSSARSASSESGRRPATAGDFRGGGYVGREPQQQQIPQQDPLDKHLMDTTLKNIKFAHGPKFTVFNDVAFQRECLEAHNKVRRVFGCPTLSWCQELADEAEKWAHTVADRGRILYKEIPGVGENISLLSANGSDHLPTGVEITELWANECERYNYSKPAWSEACQHFTQLIWKRTSEFGAARVWAPSKSVVAVVAFYAPSGNCNGINEFKQNVPQPVSGNAKLWKK